MKKIPTLFVREFNDDGKIKIITDKVTPGLEWVLEGLGEATIKIDGSCCAIIDGRFYKRYDAKHGKPVPENAIRCQEEADPITGHLPCWIPVNFDSPSDKWFADAYTYSSKEEILTDGTYEAIGLHFQNNPYGLNKDILVEHGQHKIDTIFEAIYGKRSFENIKNFLSKVNIEGIVYWKDGEPKCKIKRSDFGFEWPDKKGLPYLWIM